MISLGLLLSGTKGKQLVCRQPHHLLRVVQKNKSLFAPSFASLLLVFLPSARFSVSSTSSLLTSGLSIPDMPAPSRPYAYRIAATPSVDLSVLGVEISKTDEKRQEAFSNSRRIQIGLVKARTQLETGTPSEKMSSDERGDSHADLKELLLSSIDPTPNNRVPREANLGLRVEEYVRLQAFEHFLETGGLLSPSECTYATDEEYLAGACMGLCQDLARYGLGRATARDVPSIVMARNLVQELMEYLLQFDFRNGYLRRKYDGTKYALKALETILYELSVTGSSAESNETPDKKRAKVENMPNDALTQVRERIEHRDDIRETLIKKCRDGQKAAKQAIFAMHRGDLNRASKLLKQCEDCIKKDLQPIVEEEPPLRSGSFGAVIEEYVEAKLFFVWLMGPGGNPSSFKGKGVTSPNGTLLRPDQFDIHLEAEEYLGGMCDLTGEIGRFAVQRGTVRDVDGVKQCLEANSSIFIAIQTMERFPGTIGKKMDQLRRSEEKLERMLYEMSLSEAAGGRKVDSEEISMEEDGPTVRS